MHIKKKQNKTEKRGSVKNKKSGNPGFFILLV